jgi:hypothetical protein
MGSAMGEARLEAVTPDNKETFTCPSSSPRQPATSAA